MNGLGERTGNANLTTIIPNLQLKLGHRCLPDGRLERLTSVSHHVAELLNRAVNPQAPYVGSGAFAHKAGLHASAIARRKDAYEHVDPELVGNGTRFVVSEMAGRATITMKANELGLEMDGPAVTSVIDDLKRLEHEGYHFEAADASLELLMRRAGGWQHDFFSVESMRVITDETNGGDFGTEATVKVWVGDERHVYTAEGNGPVNAIDNALRLALAPAYPAARPGPPHRLQGPHPRRRRRHRRGHPCAARRHRTASATGPRSVSARTSSRRRGGHSRRASSTACSTRTARKGAMAAPKFTPTTTIGDVTSYRSPDVVPDAWTSDRPGDLVGRQPSGPRLGFQGPDQGYALTLASRLKPQLVLSDNEHAADAVAGCTAVAMRRASMYGRAPVIHDLRIAFTIWGFLDTAPPAELVALRVKMFEGAGELHHYDTVRAHRRAGARGDAAPDA